MHRFWDLCGATRNISIMSAERLSRSTIPQSISAMKRHPPSFHHLPQLRGQYNLSYPITAAQNSLVAKKLKRVWVAKQKTKSKWKAQKRREGILTQRDALSRSATLSDPLKSPHSSVVHRERGASVEEGESDRHGDESQNGSGDEPTVTKSKQSLRSPEESSTSAGPSLRDLQKQAYSPAALHHYKSRPLHHSKGRMATRDAQTPESSRKKDVGGGTRNRGRRGGQPDMRLRMSALLEKVKRDYT